MPKILDKKALWKEAVEAIEATISPGLFQLLLNQCYLDSVEDGVAIVMTDSEFMQGMVQRKAVRQLRFAFGEIMGREVKVRTAVGHPRIFESKQNQPISIQSTGGNPPQDELAILHDKYGDIMGIVDDHPVFKKASIKADKGGWGIWPQLLTNACKDFGVIETLTALRYIANKPNIRNPRGYFIDMRDTGRIGNRLAKSASVIG